LNTATTWTKNRSEIFSVAHYFVKNVPKLTDEEEMAKAFAKIDINKGYIANKIMEVNKQLNPENHLAIFNLIQKNNSNPALGRRNGR
jgi:hypothetical protein